SDSPNALVPPHRQKFEVTITWVVSRYAPATAMQRPRRNCPIPPVVPPAPAIRSLAMNAILVLAAVILAGQASGEFKAGTRAPIRPKYAAAYETRDMRDARKHAVEVILSEAPVDVAAAVADLQPHTNIINQPALMEHNYIVLVVRPDGDVSMNATYSERMSQFVDMTGAMGSLKAALSTHTQQ